MPRPVRIFIISMFLAVISVVPLTQAGIELSEGRRPRFFDGFLKTPTQPNLRAYEKVLEDSSFWARMTRPWIQWIWLRVFGYGGDKALLGREGWLFYKPDVRYLVEPGAAAEPLAAILDFRDQLAGRGIHLIVVPAPGKPAVHPEKLTWRGARVLVSHTHELMERLRARNVETLDLFAAFGRSHSETSHYLALDTHWSGPAARLAGELAGDRILALGWVERGSIRYDLKTVPVSRAADIARMISLPGSGSYFPPETTQCDQVFRSADSNLYRDDPSSPVLVLGDSFLRIYETDAPRSAGFIAHLARKLGTPVASIVNDGGASTLVRQELSRRPQLLVGKKVVVWEFVERDVRFGMDGWKLVSLPN